MKKESILKKIDTPEELRKLNVEDLTQLANELRQEIIDVVSTKQGHLGASLGVVELDACDFTMLFDTPIDLLVWDVGHQAYGHKIFTGRRRSFFIPIPPTWWTCSGFPSQEKKVIFDAFGVGHCFYVYFGCFGDGSWQI